MTDLGNAGGEGEGQDANTLSPDLDYANVQADYIDDVADAICKDMKAKGLDSEELAAMRLISKQHSCRYRFTCVTLVLCVCLSKVGHSFSFELLLAGSGYSHVFGVHCSAENQASELLSDGLETHGSSISVASHDTQV